MNKPTGYGLAVAHVFAQTREMRPIDTSKLIDQQSRIMDSLRIRCLIDQVKPKPIKSTKLQAARDLMKSTKLNRNDAIQLLITELGLTKAGATTYYSKIKSVQE